MRDIFFSEPAVQLQPCLHKNSQLGKVERQTKNVILNNKGFENVTYCKRYFPSNRGGKWMHYLVQNDLNIA